MSYVPRLRGLISSLTELADELAADEAVRAAGPAPVPVAAEPAPVVVPEGTEVTVELQVSDESDNEFYVDVILTDVDDEDKFVALQMDLEWADDNLEFLGHDTSIPGVWNAPGWAYRSNPTNGKIGAFASRLSAVKAEGLLTRLKFKANGAVDTTLRVTDFSIHSTRYAALNLFPSEPSVPLSF